MSQIRTNKQKISQVIRYKSTVPFSVTLNRYIEIKFEELKNTGLKIEFVDREPYANFEEMKADYLNKNRLLISKLHAENNIFGSVEMNCKFRVIHDFGHLENNLDFSAEKELILNYIQLQEAQKFGLCPFDLALLNIETAGQIKYFLETGDFPSDQRKFAVSELIKFFNY